MDINREIEDRPLSLTQTYYKISEVSKLLGIKPEVLRYWESNFAKIKILRIYGRRTYQKKDVLILQEIKDLLYNKGMTFDGVKKFFKEQGLIKNKIVKDLALNNAVESLKRVLKILE